MNSKSDSTLSRLDARLGKFGHAALSMLDELFPRMYSAYLVAHPSFSDSYRANIAPQFDRCAFIAISVLESHPMSGIFSSNIERFDNIEDIEDLLDSRRYEHIIFSSEDLKVMTAWAQAEYAIVALDNSLVNQYAQWLQAMQEREVVYRIV